VHVLANICFELCVHSDGRHIDIRLFDQLIFSMMLVTMMMLELCEFADRLLPPFSVHFSSVDVYVIHGA